jgi:hypothetical protein
LHGRVPWAALLLERVQKRRLEPYVVASSTSTSMLPDQHG